MGDVVQILGIGDSNTVDVGADDAVRGIPRKVADVMMGHPSSTNKVSSSGVDLPPIVPTNTGGRFVDTTASNAKAAMVKIGNKWISSGKKARKWAWAPFSSSSRTDGLLLHHWVRANVEYPDYPYARFDIHLDPVTYSSEEEYHEILEDPSWTKSETDQLLELAKRYELRWPVIYDRWCEHFDYYNQGTPQFRRIEDIQHRYYAVAAILLQSRVSHEANIEVQNLSKQVDPVLADGAAVDGARLAAADARLIETAAARALATAEPKHQPLIPNLGTGTTNKVPFDLKYERERREHLERLWNRSKEEEEEEEALRQELKQVEAQLRKMKKSGAHHTSKSAAASRSATPVQDLSPAVIDKAFATTAPIPVPGTPYLQSARNVPPASGGNSGINKMLMAKLNEIMSEMNVPEDPLPTKKVCDLYDTVRKNILILLVLQKKAQHKEGILQSKRLALGKRKGDAKLVDEETLIGIEPVPQEKKQQAQSSTTAKAVNAKASRSIKPKTPTNPKPKSGATTSTGEQPNVPSMITTNVASAPVKVAKKTPSAATKRKRKSDTSKSSPSAAIAAAAVAAAAAEVVQSEARAAAVAAVAVSSQTNGNVVGAVDASSTTADAAAKPPSKKRTKKT